MADLKNQLGFMSEAVQDALFATGKSLASEDKKWFFEVRRCEDKINNYHKEIDHLIFKTLARHSPVARDLRQLLAACKINVDLERMGDLSRSISYCSQDYHQGSPLQLTASILEMADLVVKMVKQSFVAFSTGNIELAHEVLELDDFIDDYNERLSNELIQKMKDGAPFVDSAMALFRIVRSLERMGDHATNISEEVIFILTGEDIRHDNKLGGESTHGA